ncbi:MAG: hypothetical protein WBO34_07215 [Gammaproteobacteria bacterium]
MYIDSLTIAALVLFIVAMYAFVRFCMVKYCMLTSVGKDDSTAVTKREEQE